MKMRTAYFCVMCDEEVCLEELHEKSYCPNCGHASMTCVRRVYSVKVEDK